jgi:SAM-dependent methyltransferase
MRVVLPDALQRETERLVQMWARHDAAWLREYLATDVEDPRINLQSVLSRHFILQGLSGERFVELMDQELQFAAVMNWLLAQRKQSTQPEESAAMLHALERGSDNAEGLEIPAWLSRAYANLPGRACGLLIPNYVESQLRAGAAGVAASAAVPMLDRRVLELFQRLWCGLLAREVPSELRVLEAGCGSANDYRFLWSYGIARLVDYTGFDLCAKNVRNAQGMFPDGRFRVANVMDLEFPDKSQDLCILHDLLEHLSIEAMERSITELCRVTRAGLCVGFFNMHEEADHVVVPVEKYHVNHLSLGRVREAFERQGGTTRAVHLESFLRECFGCEHTHNPDAYTVWVRF